MRLIETHIEVEDIEKSLKLYTTILPHKHIEQWADGNVAALIFEDGSAFGIWKKGQRGIHNGQGGQHVHFAFQIETNQYDIYKQKIINAGLEPLEHVWETGDKSVYFFDYDDNQGEFITADWLKLNNL